MGIDFGNDAVGTSLPWVRHQIEENIWKVNDPEGMGDHIILKSKHGELQYPVLIDIRNIQLGWLKIANGGRDFIEWPNNDPKAIARPEEKVMSFGEMKPAYQRAFQVMVFSKANFVDGDRQLAPLRVFSSSSAGHRAFVEKLYEAAEQSEHFASKVPAVQIGEAVYTKEFGGPTKVHEFEIVDWMDAPQELAEAEFPKKLKNSDAPVSQPQASPPSQGGGADAVASGDFSGVGSEKTII
jgi:hypothetical protein